MKAIIQFDNKTLEAHLNKSTIVDELYVMFTLETTPQYKRLKLDVHPKRDILLQSIEIQIDTSLDKYSSQVFCNGFLSSSESRLYNFTEKPDALRSIAKPFLGYSGDYHFDFIPRKKGILHSWAYGYIQSNVSRHIDFIGSLDESTGFTCLLYNVHNQAVTIKKDVENLHLTHSYPAIDVILMQGDTPSVLSTYYALQNMKTPTKVPLDKWIYAVKNTAPVSEKNVLDKLQFIKEQEPDADYFLIKQGWASHISDWTSTNNNFPKGMAHIAQHVHNQGLKACLWLVPFLVEADSSTFKKHPEWLVQDSNGKPLKVGFAPQWLGWSNARLYALNFYNKDVQEYLTGVLHLILNHHRFDMVQLDMLYAVCILPRPNKTRGQIMHDALAFLRQIVGNKKMYVGDVPIASAFGLADYCRIGSNIFTEKENKLLALLRYRERGSNIRILQFEKVK